MMVLLACFVMTSLLLASLHVVDSGPTPAHYDQRQDGKYNVKIHLKDFKLISLGSLSSDSLNMGEYDDSNYDYEDPPDPAETSTTTKASSVPITTTTSSPIKLINSSLTNNLTITDGKLDTNNNSSTHAALTSLTNATQTADCPDKNGTTSGPEEPPSSSGRPARVQPSHVTRHRTTSTPRPTPYHPYSIISTTRRPPVKQGTVRKMRCRPGYLRDRSGRCRKVKEQEKTTTS